MNKRKDVEDIKLNIVALDDRVKNIEEAILNGVIRESIIDSINFLIQSVKQSSVYMKSRQNEMANLNNRIQQMQGFIQQMGLLETFNDMVKKSEEKQAEVMKRIQEQQQPNDNRSGEEGQKEEPKKDTEMEETPDGNGAVSDKETISSK